LNSPSSSSGIASPSAIGTPRFPPTATRADKATNTDDEAIQGTVKAKNRGFSDKPRSRLIQCIAGKITIRTFGCQMNEYDSDKMADVLGASTVAAEGSLEKVFTDVPRGADVILFNTCSVREKAQEKVFHDLGRVAPQADRNPGLIIGVGGCVASQEGAAIVRARRMSIWCSARRPCTACRS
jgi:Ni,Fe-hydrogenase III small subunit